MSRQTDLRVLTLPSIAHRCARETEFFFQHQPNDPRYCFELFRRAILDRSQRAWELIYAQYRPLVAGWVTRHPAFPSSREEVGYFVNRAFERMWGALSSDRFSSFPDLRSLLRYLQMCVHSVVLDQVRLAERAVPASQIEDLARNGRSPSTASGDPVLVGLVRQEFWDLVNTRLHNEKERQVVYGSFVLALRPRELYARYQETFEDVREVYRVKENVLARLRRDSELRKILGPDA